MIELPLRLEGKQFQLYHLEEQLKPLGYVIGGGWDYDHGYFDYKIADDLGYQFLRVPFRAVDGQLDSHGTTVELGRPFLLAHKYQQGIDDFADVAMWGRRSTSLPNRKTRMRPFPSGIFPSVKRSFKSWSAACSIKERSRTGGLLLQ